MTGIKKYKDIFILLFLICICGFYSVNAGMDRSADACNYHIYNPWAFLNNRITYDIMPAGIQSYFNPILDLPYFLMIKYFNNHPCIVTFLMGIGFALFLFIVYKIAELVFKDFHTNIMSCLCTITVGFTYIVWRSVGWLSQDLFVNFLGLCSVYLILKIIKSKQFIPKYLILSGSLAGIACGLRLSSTVFAIPLIFTFLIFIKNFEKPYKSFLLFIFSMGISFFAINGFWMYKLYINYGNPFMPYFNHIFHSPLIKSDNVFSMDFRHTKDWRVFLFFPFYTSWESWIKILYFIFILNFLTMPFFNEKAFEEKYKIETLYMNFLLVFIFCSYIYWINLFGVIRYAIFAAGLAGIIIYSYACKFLFMIFQKQKNKNGTKGNIILILIFLFLTILLLPINLKKIKKTNRIYPIENNKILYVENMHLPDNTSVLVNHNCAIISVFQNSTAQFIHLNAVYYNRRGIQILSDNLISEIKQILSENPDKIYIISTYNLEQDNNMTIEEINSLILKFRNYNENFNLMSQNLNLDDKARKKLFNKNYNYSKLPSKYSIFSELSNYGIDISSPKCVSIKNNINNAYYLCKLKLTK